MRQVVAAFDQSGMYTVSGSSSVAIETFSATSAARRELKAHGAQRREVARLPGGVDDGDHAEPALRAPPRPRPRRGRRRAPAGRHRAGGLDAGVGAQAMT